MMLLRPVSFTGSLLIVNLSESLIGNPFKYQYNVGEGFPTVSQEQLIRSVGLAQSDEGRILGATVMKV